MTLKGNLLKEKLCNEILPLVSKPGRYLGNEYNVIVKDPAQVELKIALAFPDIYDLGMSHLGLKIFYETLNSHPHFVAERVFSPWIDMEKMMRDEDIPLYSLETYTPIKEFDILAMSLQHELCYTTVLNMLDLAKIPVLAARRGEDDPIVIGGGHATFNPEPMSDFMDAFVIGDGEKVIEEISELVLQLKKQKAPRKEILHQLTKLQGIYVPSLYQVTYKENGQINEIKSLIDDIPNRVLRRVEDLEEAPYPTKQLVPHIEITHDRIALEIQRGCTRGCRFCQAGYITRPRRERKMETLFRQAREGIAQTGLSEVSLLSLSSSDYDEIKDLVTKMVHYFEPMKVSLSLPSLRLDTFSIDIAKMIQRVKKTGFTFAVESGSERLRNVINKTISDADLDKVIMEVFSNGWLSAKLYFMIGLPTENYEDLQHMVNLIERTGKLAKQFAKRHCKVTASISVFVPKPHSAFENASQLDREEVQKRIYWVKDRIHSHIVKLKWHDPEQSYLEGVCSRGDRRVGKAIYAAWQKGSHLDNWSDQFNKNIWAEAFKDANIDPDFFAIRAREKDEVLPWSHIDSGVTRKFLLEEYDKGVEEKTIGDCSIDKFCSDCGVEDCTHMKANQKFLWPYQKTSNLSDLENTFGDIEQPPSSTHLRIKFSKDDEIRFISHLDLIRTMTASIRRAGIPMAYSQGFSPQMKFHLALALSLGFSSSAEYAEFVLTVPMTADEFTNQLAPNLPNGIRIMNCWTISPQAPGFGKIIELASYRITHLPKQLEEPEIQNKIQEILAQDTLVMIRQTKEGDSKQLDIRPLIENISCNSFERELAVELLLKVGSNGNARPEEIMRLLMGEDDNQIKLLHIHRTGLYSIHEGLPIPIDGLGAELLIENQKISV